jgi:MFS family permease
MESLSASRRTQILALLAVAQLMGVLDFSIVNVALPSIQRTFHLAPADLQWMVSAYALMFGGFLLLSGRAADLFDRKRVFILGLGLFSLASLAGGLAPSSPVILATRALQGLGAAIVSPAALALLTTTFPEGPERNRALSVFGSVSGIGFGAGVILGGVLTSVLSWRWVFFVNVPVGLLVLLSAFLLLPTSRASVTQKPLDLTGALLLTGAMVSLVLALSQVASLEAGMVQVLLPGLLAVVLGGIAGGQIAAWAIRRGGLRGALALGPILIALGSMLLTRITPVGGVAWVVVGYLIAGVGIVCAVVTTAIAATAHLGPELQGLAAGLLNTSQQVGAALGTSLASVVASAVALAVGGDPAVAATTGYQATLYLAIGLSVIAALLAILADEPEPRLPRTRAHRPVSNNGTESQENLESQMSASE